ncbi:MAG: hypothetical protein ACRDP6_17255, partial [Actinoallomurus sp.]
LESGSPTTDDAAIVSIDAPDEDEDVAFEAPRLPQHGAFGSVWDSQLGMAAPPAAATPVASGLPVDEGYEDEPEIPEYLLAERRQQAGRPGGGRGPMSPAGRGGRGRGRGGAYQVALDRERYGRSGTGSSFTAPSQRPPSGGRPLAGRRDRPQPREVPIPAGSGGGDPWSEVPPELEELLRAELARKAGPAPVRSAPAAALPAVAEAPTPAPKRRVTRKPTTMPEAAAMAARESMPEAAAAAPKRRVTRKPTAMAAEPDAAPTAAKAAPKRRVTRKAPATD